MILHTPAQLLALAVAGGCGAVLRVSADTLVRRLHRTDTPWALFVINVTGSFALGILTGCALHGAHESHPMLLTIVGTGLLGGYTTFSTASIETLQFIARRRWGSALIAGPGAITAAVACAVAGSALGRMI